MRPSFGRRSWQYVECAPTYYVKFEPSPKHARDGGDSGFRARCIRVTGVRNEHDSWRQSITGIVTSVSGGDCAHLEPATPSRRRR
jgi:hypothetical protein